MHLLGFLGKAFLDGLFQQIREIRLEFGLHFRLEQFLRLKSTFVVNLLEMGELLRAEAVDLHIQGKVVSQPLEMINIVKMIIGHWKSLPSLSFKVINVFPWTLKHSPWSA